MDEGVLAVEKRDQATTRRTFVLATSVQLFSPFASGVAMGQSAATDLSALDVAVVDELVRNYKLATSEDFSVFFLTLWRAKVRLALAEVEKDVEEFLANLTTRARDALARDFGKHESIPLETVRRIVVNTVHVQNIFFGVSTNLETGLVLVVTENLKRMTDYYCSFYPYCK